MLKKRTIGLLAVAFLVSGCAQLSAFLDKQTPTAQASDAPGEAAVEPPDQSPNQPLATTAAPQPAQDTAPNQVASSAANDALPQAGSATASQLTQSPTASDASFDENADVGAIAPGSPAAEQATPPHAVAPPTAQPTSGQPALWRASRGETDAYLFGAIHTLPNNTQWKTTTFLAAMADAEVTVLEADTSSPDALSEMNSAAGAFGFYRDGRTLQSVVGLNRAERLRAIAEASGVETASLNMMKPWLATLLVTQALLTDAGFDTSASVDAAVGRQAMAEGDRLAYLETPVFQIEEVLAALDEGETLVNFDLTLSQFNDFETLVRRLFNAWLAGDTKILEEEIIAELRATAPKSFKTLFTDRNETWTSYIAEALLGQDDLFIAVGAGHLIGDGSVIEMLRDRGYTVERIQ
ncbi:MAG: TraB/GumN family protein [Pseudomonadota bacterium]